MLSYSDQRAAERKREATTRALRKAVKKACRGKKQIRAAIERGTTAKLMGVPVREGRAP